MTEPDIHCNVVKCRKPLSAEQRACVTSCSHVFCESCANSSFSKELICPACHTTLSEGSDDIIITQLNPTEEYKSSVLAGLKPDIILDVCARAIAFYEYQTSQELAFRAVIQKSTQEKYNELRNKSELMQRDLIHMIKAIINDYETEKKKSQQIYSKLEDKTKQFQKLQTMYERLKRKTVGPNIQSTFTNQPPRPPMNRAEPMIYNPMRFNNQQQTDEDDIISRIGRSSSTNRSIFVPPPQQSTRIYPNRNSPSRIPSPVKSIYSVRSHRPKYYKKRISPTISRT
ncbi:uncharacterized protein EV154DRAFT_502121 [Mucor mucedo]|uniref:uncharacterized protein n=1 Tax=Mucor mucedo TaxID=29922 RepID=UPI00221FCBF8|nr:uncharacterized protein EV154DRAFT_502121 [Mucor mucedo]KAI7893452.1 hypothetical protein EV154DRAFT_502121 [Mucor mucedo]